MSYSQNDSYNITYKGSASADINGQSDIATVIVPSGCKVTYPTTINVFHPKNDVTVGANSQYINNYSVNCTNSNFNRTELTDYWGNEYTEYKQFQGTDITRDFFLTQYYTATTSINLIAGFTSGSSFNPLCDIPADLLADYAQPTIAIQSDDPQIKSLALSLTRACTTMDDAVKLIAEWVVGNISYANSTNNNKDQNASQVFGRKPKTGNCTGYTNLICALLRSVGIPARFVSGVNIAYPYIIPYANGGSVSLGAGVSDAHAVYEVYYPNGGWRMADAQMSLNFCSTHFVAHRFGPDNIDALSEVSVSYDVTGTVPSIRTKSMCGEITSFDNNYLFDDCTKFKSPLPKILLLSEFPGFATGIWDAVTIMNPPPNKISPYPPHQNIPPNTTLITACSPASFYAEFSTGSTPATQSDSYDWSIELYHGSTTYVYAQESINIVYNMYNASQWVPTLGVLPSYDWALDPNGNIYGKVKVTVHISDGDTKTDEWTIAVNPNQIISNITYSTNTTINATCIKLNLTNVGITSPASVTVNSNGLGIGINGTFVAQKGSTLTINK